MTIDPHSQSITQDVLAGGGEMGALMRSLDWTATPLGPVETWPQSLRTALSILLSSRHPMFIWWGSELVQFYNDGYRPSLGVHKHPQALGQPGRICWEEIWSIIGPQIDSVMSRGEETWNEDQLVPFDRNGFMEEIYFTYGYSPIRDETGNVGGTLVVCTETTRRVIGERRMQTLRDLAARMGEMLSVNEACYKSIETLALNPADLPFSLLYLLSSDAASLSLTGSTGLAPSHPASPERMEVVDSLWPIDEVFKTGQPVFIDNIAARFGEKFQVGVWPEPVHSAFVLPIARPGQRPYGIFIVGISPRLALDGDYEGFLTLVAGQIASAIANAHTYEEERQRAELLMELDRAKTVFFNNISHEFRTPLTLMVAPIEDALTDANPTLTGESLQMVHRNALRLLRLVNTLLDFSRIEAGRIHATYEPTDLAAFTSELASVFRSAIEKAGLKFVINASPLSNMVYVDREMWEKIVLNLLSNALKFTLTGSICVKLSEVPDFVQLEVSDTGIGIPAEELPHVFERFHRVETTAARTQEGTGIGLSLVHELARLHQGSVEVTSKPGEGSCFTVSIPLGKDHLPADQVGTTQSYTSTQGISYLEEAMRWTGITQEATASPISTSIPEIPSEQQAAHILLADDNADMLDYLKRLLSRQYQVEAVSDGLAALAAAQAHRPDLVLTDIMMPGLDGFGLLKALHNDPRTSSIPVMLLSARAGEEASAEGFQAGADDYLVKPFSARELLARVNANLRLARLHRTVRESEEQHRWLIENTTEAIWRVDVEQPVSTSLPEDEQIEKFYETGHLTACNEGMARMYGFASSEEMVGLRLGDIMPAAEPQNVAYLKAFIRGGYKLIDAESIEVDHEGHTKYILNNLVGVVENDRMTGAWGTSRDITERKRAELERERLLALSQQSQHEAEEGRQDLYRLFMQTPAPVCIIQGPDLVFELANPLYRQIVGNDDIVGKPMLEALPDLKGQGFDDLLHNVMRTGIAHIGNETLVRLDPNNDGKLEDIYVTFIYAPLRNKEGVVDRIIVFCNDVTNQVVAREQIAESQAQLRFMAESVPQKIFTATPDGAVDYFNQQWMDFTGLSFDQIKGWGWRQFIHPDDSDENLRLWLHSLATGEPLQFEHRFRRADGIYRWHLSRVQAMHDDNGKISMWIGSATDIDDQKKVQEQKDEFLSVAAHELKTPVTSLRGFAQLLLRQFDQQREIDPIKLQRALKTIDQQSAKLTQLLSQLLDISRLEAGRLTLDRRKTDLSVLVSDLVDTMQRNTPQRVMSVQQPVSLIASVDPIRLEQVLVNLIDNALKFSAGDSTIYITLSMPTPDLLQLVVRDHGIGIPPERREHIFDRFYQAHESGFLGGMGLGLYISQQIIQLHGGKIEVEFPADGGTQFTVELPLDKSAEL